MDSHSQTPNTIFLLLTSLLLISFVLYLILKRLKPNTMNTSSQPLLPVPGRVTSGFGPRRAPTAGASTNHNGVDLSAAIGTEVHAPWEGTVVSVLWTTAGGHQVILHHPNGYRTGYAHLSQILVRRGDHVAQGATIALTGNTGTSTGPHLHFTLTNPEGQKIDPQSIFQFNA